MKKLMIAAAIVCAAAFAQAAQTNWGSSYTYASDGSGVAGKSRGTTEIYTAYLFDAYAYTTFADDVADASKGIAWVLENKSVDSYTMTGSTKTDGKIAGSTGDVMTESGSKISGFMVLIDAEEIADMKNYFVSETATADAPAPGLYGTLSFGTSKDLIASADKSNWTAVPEPTSGLLLLIGVAGLALRRRRA